MEDFSKQKDNYFTLAIPCEGFYKEKGSKFISWVFPADTEREAFIRLDEIKKLHPKARHHCFAFRLGIDGSHYRANDDGEPSGTAGKPILGQLIKNDISDVIAIVVRYFGGTLLGASGLIHAYRESTADALKNLQKKEKVISDTFSLSFDYAIMPMVMEGIKKLGLEIIEQHFQAEPSLLIGIRKSVSAKIIPELKSIISGRPVEEVSEKKVEGLIIRKLKV